MKVPLQETARQEREQYEKFFGNTKVEKKEIQKCPVRNMRVLTKSSKPQECEPVGKSYATYSSSLFIGIFVRSAYLTYSAYQSAFFFCNSCATHLSSL